MTKSKYYAMSRIGTCRSGIPFDIPRDLDPYLIGDYVNFFEVNDRVDMFCMSEAKIVPIEKSEEEYTEYESIRLLNNYFWLREIFKTLEPHLVDLGLQTSPAYVRFGAAILLV